MNRYDYIANEVAIISQSIVPEMQAAYCRGLINMASMEGAITPDQFRELQAVQYANLKERNKGLQE